MHPLRTIFIRTLKSNVFFSYTKLRYYNIYVSPENQESTNFKEYFFHRNAKTEQTETKRISL